MVEVVVLRESSRPGELHMEIAGQVVGHTAIVDQELGHTVAVERRMGREEVGRTVLVAEAGEVAVRKANEAAQVHQTVKELVRAVHRRAKEPLRVGRMAMAMEHCRAVAGKATDWAEEDQKGELAEKVPHPLRSRSRMHLSCQSGQRCPSASPPWASPPWAYRRR
jgi:hypothetical protein